MGKLELVIESDSVSIYSPKYDGETMTEFEKFLSKNGTFSQPQLKKDFDAIISVIRKMELDCGARENLFRLEGRNIKAIPLFIEQKRKRTVGTLRLYCIRISDKILIIGNGGIKTTAKYQQDPVLLGFVNQLKQIEKQLFHASKNNHVGYDEFNKMKSIVEGITI